MARNPLLILLLVVAAASAAVPVFHGDARDKVKDALNVDGNDVMSMWMAMTSMKMTMMSMKMTTMSMKIARM